MSKEKLKKYLEEINERIQEIDDCSIDDIYEYYDEGYVKCFCSTVSNMTEDLYKKLDLGEYNE